MWPDVNAFESEFVFSLLNIFALECCCVAFTDINYTPLCKQQVDRLAFSDNGKVYSSMTEYLIVTETVTSTEVMMKYIEEVNGKLNVFLNQSSANIYHQLSKFK